MLRSFLSSKSGQTTVEYLLLICVSIMFGMAFFKQVDEFLIKNPNGLIGKPLNTFKESLGGGKGHRYQSFPLRR